MIIFGVRTYFRTVGQGTFQCPRCGQPAAYQLRRGRRFIHVFFIPLIPISGPTEHWRCAQCKGKFRPAIAGAPASA